MAYGEIYKTTDWGYVTQDGFGSAYYTDANPTPARSDSLHFVIDTSINSVRTTQFSKWQGSNWLYDIDWGDGTKDLAQTGTATHTYAAAAAAYEVKVDGNVPQPFSAQIFMGGGKAQQITEIKSWGVLEYWTGTFSLGNTSITTLDMKGFTWEPNAQGNMYSFCGNCQNLTSISFDGMTNSEKTTSLGAFIQSNYTNLVRSITWGDFEFKNIDLGNALEITTNAVEIMTTSEYDYMLNRLANTVWTLDSARTLKVGAAKYSSTGKTDRDYLINTKGWTILDGGQA